MRFRQNSKWETDTSEEEKQIDGNEVVPGTARGTSLFLLSYLAIRPLLSHELWQKVVLQETKALDWLTTLSIDILLMLVTQWSAKKGGILCIGHKVRVVTAKVLREICYGVSYIASIGRKTDPPTLLILKKGST